MRHFAAFESDLSTTLSPGDGVSPQPLTAEPLAREEEVVPALQTGLPPAVDPVVSDPDAPSREGLPVFEQAADDPPEFGALFAPPSDDDEPFLPEL